MGPLDSLMGDDVAEVQDHVVLAIEDYLGHGPADRIGDVVQAPLGHLLVGALARRVGHLAKLGGEPIPQIRGGITGLSECVLRAGAGGLRLAEGDRRNERLELASLACRLDVLGARQAAFRDDHRS